MTQHREGAERLGDVLWDRCNLFRRTRLDAGTHQGDTIDRWPSEQCLWQL